MPKRYNLFNFYFLCIIWINFCACFSAYLTIVIATSYAMDILRTSSSMAGFASGIFVIGVLFARLAVGRNLDRLDLKKWLLIALIACLCFNMLYFYAHDIVVLDFARFLHGFGYGLCSSMCGTIVARIIPSFKRGVGIGYYSLSVVLASGIAPFVAVYLVNHNAFDLGFYLSLGAIVCAIVCVFAMKVRELRGGYLELAKPHMLKDKILTFIEPSAVRISFIGFMMSFCFGGIVSFIGAYCKTRDLVMAGSMFFLIYALSSLIARPIAGKIYDTKGHNAIILPSLVCFVIALLLLAFAQSGLVLILGAIACGLGYGNFISSAQSYAINTAPKDKMGLATATYYVGSDFGVGIGPYFLGFAIGAFGYTVAFVGCAFIVLCALLAYYKLIAK